MSYFLPYPNEEIFGLIFFVGESYSESNNYYSISKMFEIKSSYISSALEHADELKS